VLYFVQAQRTLALRDFFHDPSVSTVVSPAASASQIWPHVLLIDIGHQTSKLHSALLLQSCWLIRPCTRLVVQAAMRPDRIGVVKDALKSGLAMHRAFGAVANVYEFKLHLCVSLCHFVKGT
jgi:hypothetical protein